MADSSIGLGRRIAFTLALLVMISAAGEFTARAILARRAGVQAATDSGRNDWLSALRTDLGDDVLLYESDPHLFWRLRPGTDASFVNSVYESRDQPIRWSVTINQEGQRGPGYPTSASRVVAALGDSCTFGFRVDDEDTWPAQLERRLDSEPRFAGSRVVNYGVPGYTSFQGRRVLEGILRVHRPNLVVLAFGANDHEEDAYGDQERAALSASTRVRIAGFLRRSAAVRFLSAALRDEHRTTPDAKPRTRRVSASAYRDNMRAMIELARTNGVEVVLLDLVFVAPIYRYINQSLATEYDVPFIDGRALLRAAALRLESDEFAAERRRIDQFWRDRVVSYRRVYFDDAYYERLLAEEPWPTLLRYFMVEPVHANRLGNRVIADAVYVALTAAEQGKGVPSQPPARAHPSPP